MYVSCIPVARSLTWYLTYAPRIVEEKTRHDGFDGRRAPPEIARDNIRGATFTDFLLPARPSGSFPLVDKRYNCRLTFATDWNVSVPLRNVKTGKDDVNKRC